MFSNSLVIASTIAAQQWMVPNRSLTIHKRDMLRTCPKERAVRTFGGSNLDLGVLGGRGAVWPVGSPVLPWRCLTLTKSLIRPDVGHTPPSLLPIYSRVLQAPNCSEPTSVQLCRGILVRCIGISQNVVIFWSLENKIGFMGCDI